VIGDSHVPAAVTSVKHPSLQNGGPSGLTAGPSSAPPTFRRRLRVQLHKGRLDQQLAEGFGPDPIEDRALRARQLTRMRTRRQLARSLRARVNDAQRPAAPRMSAAVPLSRRVVLRWRESLLGLAERLERPDPVNPCGVARVLVLLTDGTGPLYNPGAADRMGDAVWWIADGLALDAGEDPGHAPSLP
jgi:hypothetical protein